jgi:hypothetical protein
MRVWWTCNWQHCARWMPGTIFCCMQHFTTHLWFLCINQLNVQWHWWHYQSAPLSRSGGQRITGHAGAQWVSGFKPRSSVHTVKLENSVLVHPVTPTSTAEGPPVYPVKPGSTAYPFRPGSTLYPFKPGSTTYPFQSESTLYPFKTGSTAYLFRPGPILYPFKPGSTAYPFRPASTPYPFKPGSTTYPFRPGSTQYPRWHYIS